MARALLGTLHTSQTTKCHLGGLGGPDYMKDKERVQWRTTEMMRGLEHFSYKSCVSCVCFSLEKAEMLIKTSKTGAYRVVLDSVQ